MALSSGGAQRGICPQRAVAGFLWTALLKPAHRQSPFFAEFAREGTVAPSSRTSTASPEQVMQSSMYQLANSCSVLMYLCKMS